MQSSRVPQHVWYCMQCISGERVAPRRPASSAQLAFFRQFDMNGDDTLDYTEFMLVLTLLR